MRFKEFVSDTCPVCGQTPCNCTGIKEEKVRLDPACWHNKKIGNPKTKMKGGVRVNNCVPKKGAASGLNEFSFGGDDDDTPKDDPYKYPKPEHYRRSVDFFGKFEANHFDKEDMDDATGVFKGYWYYGNNLKQIAYFKFDNPRRTGSNDPGMGWYYEPQDEDVAEGYSIGKVLSLPELLDQIKHILTAKHPGIGWRMTMPAENTFLFSAQNDYDVWSMLVVEPGGNDWVAVGHGMVDPDGKPIIFDRQQLPMTLASASEIADEAIQTYHDIDLSDYADDEDYNQGVAEGSLNEFAPGGNSASSYYAVTANFVSEFSQQKEEEIQDLIAAGWTKQDLKQAGTLQGQAADIAHFEQVRDGFLKGLKPGFDAYLQGDTQMKDQLGEYWLDNDLPLNQDWEKIYGEPWGEDMDEAEAMFEAMDRLAHSLARKNNTSVDLVWESFDALPDYVLYETAQYQLSQLNEDWQKVNKQDKTDGMSPKAVKAYRREHPGSKLKTAVTTKPSKLKAGSKAAKRRKSFCARMSGVKGPMKDEKGRPTAKAKALKRWNCNEDLEESGNPQMVARKMSAPRVSTVDTSAPWVKANIQQSRQRKKEFNDLQTGREKFDFLYKLKTGKTTNKINVQGPNQLKLHIEQYDPRTGNIELVGYKGYGRAGSKEYRYRANTNTFDFDYRTREGLGSTFVYHFSPGTSLELISQQDRVKPVEPVAKAPVNPASPWDILDKKK